MYGHVITIFSRMGSLTHFVTHGASKVQLSLYKPFRVFRSSFKSAYDFVEKLRVQLIEFFE